MHGRTILSLFGALRDGRFPGDLLAEAARNSRHQVQSSEGPFRNELSGRSCARGSRVRSTPTKKTGKTLAIQNQSTYNAKAGPIHATFRGR